MPGLSRYLTPFRRGDYVDVVADPSVQKGMPYHFYHGRTGQVFNVSRNAIGVEMTKIIGNRQLRKRIHVRTEHVRRSRCNEDFLNRVLRADALRAEAKKKGEKVVVKREPVGPREGYTIKAKECVTETCKPLEFVANYF